MGLVIYTDDLSEISPRTSWTGLSPVLRTAEQRLSYEAGDRVAALFGYASPDAVIALDDRPILSIEQTAMNPSGHNIPQRFSCLVRAAEFGVPSILYYPEYSRRTLSDPNVRYLNVRVPLAQQRLTDLFGVPSISVFWPTDSATRLPSSRQAAHGDVALLIAEIVAGALGGTDPSTLRLVQLAQARMNDAILRYASRYRDNASVRTLLPAGIDSAVVPGVGALDPPDTIKLQRTPDYLRSLPGRPSDPSWTSIEARLLERPLTLVLTGTANRMRDDSEHPWPGYLTLYDILYCRTGPQQTNRRYNLTYRLPVDVDLFARRAGQGSPPSLTLIADSFADLIELSGGALAGRPIRGSAPPLISRRA